MARYHIEIMDYDGESPPTSKYTDMVFAAFDIGDSIELEVHMNGCTTSDLVNLAAELGNELEEIAKQCGCVREVKRLKRILHREVKKKSKGK